MVSAADEPRRVAVLASAGGWLPAIVRALADAGAQVVVVGDAPEDMELGAVARVPGAIQSAVDVAARLAELGAVDGFVLHPAVAPRAGETARRRMGALPRQAVDRAESALEDDALWDESLEQRLAMPWRWLRATLAVCRRRGQGAITVLIPGAARPELVLAPDEVAWREALATFVLVSSFSTQATRVRLNGVLVTPSAFPEELGRLCAVLAGADAGGLHGQVMSARAPLPEL